MVDLSSFMSFFVNMMVTGVTNSINFYDSIILYGSITLLDFILAMVLIPTGLTIMLAILKSGKLAYRAERRADRRKES